MSTFLHRLLFELDTKTDPVWHCLSSQYRWIKKIMSESFDEQIVLVEGIVVTFVTADKDFTLVACKLMHLRISFVELRKSDEYQQSQNITLIGRTALFKQILGAVNSSEFESQFGK